MVLTERKLEKNDSTSTEGNRSLKNVIWRNESKSVVMVIHFAFLKHQQSTLDVVWICQCWLIILQMA
jgi:hypothetical protein